MEKISVELGRGCNIWRLQFWEVAGARNAESFHTECVVAEEGKVLPTDGFTFVISCSDPGQISRALKVDVSYLLV